MPLEALPLLSFLDPRPWDEAVEAPYADAVCIPWNELSQRPAELPRKDELIRVIGDSPHQDSAIELLRQIGRDATAAPKPVPAKVMPRGRLWSPNSFLEGKVGLLKPESALDLACGTGRDAVYLASMGWKVTGLDILPDAVERARQLAGRYLAEGQLPTFQQQDLSKDMPDGTYDLVCCFYYLNPPLLRHVPKILKPNGTAMIELFTDLDRETHGKPKRTVASGELPTLLPELEVIEYEEGWHFGRHTARLLARRDS